MRDIPIVCRDGFEPTPAERAWLQKRGNENGAKSAEVFADGTFDDGYPAMGINWNYGEQEFDRIRRITGYLVGTLGRWNSAKQAEERDRVKHGIAIRRDLAPITTAVEEDAR